MHLLRVHKEEHGITFPDVLPGFSSKENKRRFLSLMVMGWLLHVLPGLSSKENKHAEVSQRSKIGIGVIIFLFFLAFYLYNGLGLITADRVRSQGKHDNDMYFQADSRYAVSALTEADIHHNRILLHPLFIIYFNPLGYELNQVIQDKDITATVYCAAVGALGVSVAWYFFILIGAESLNAILYASIFGFSASHLIFSIVPDTYIFSALGMVILLMVAWRSRKLRYWIGISIYLTGITLSNIAFAFAAAFFCLLNGRLRLMAHKEKIIKYIMGISVTFIGLSIIQRLIYHKWMFRFLSRADKEGQFLFLPDNMAEGWLRLKYLALHMFFFNISAPVPSLVNHPLNPDIALVSFHQASLLSYEWVGMLALVIWIILLGQAGWMLIRHKLYQHKLVKTMLLCLVINATLHFFYGEDLMLYSCHWTFFILALVFYSLEKAKITRILSLQYSLLLMVFALFLLVNNSLVVDEIIRAF